MRETEKALIERRRGKPSKVSSAYVANFIDLIIGENEDSFFPQRLTDHRYTSWVVLTAYLPSWGTVKSKDVSE